MTTCRRCDAPLPTRPPGYCSPYCRNHDQCACGALKTKRTRRCRACEDRAVIRRFSCWWCGKTFRKKNHVQFKYCTREHCFAAKRARREARNLAYRLELAARAAARKAERSRPRLCACGVIISSGPRCAACQRVKRAAAYQRDRGPRPARSCRACGRPVPVRQMGKGRNRTYCSTICARMAEYFDLDSGPVPRELIEAKYLHGQAVWAASDPRRFREKHGLDIYAR